MKTATIYAMVNDNIYNVRAIFLHDKMQNDVDAQYVAIDKHINRILIFK